jgi:serine/threonine-protein kinase
LIGTTLVERYRVVRKIAEGGMGAVYEAEQIALGRKVAIKVLHGHLASDEEIARRFEREARATTAIGHPNIVEVVDFGALPDGARFLVLEYLDGRDLGRLLREVGPLPFGRAARLAIQIAEGAHAAHEKGIVHRDLKPENVIVIGEGTPSERVKIVDFGISKYRDAAMDEAARTRTGTALGTPYFMAPEQAQGRRDVDARADVYSLGAIVFRLLTGQHPFDDASYPMLIVKICTEEAPSLATWRTDLPAELVALVARMLSKDPITRPQSMMAVKEALAPFAADAREPVLTGAAGTASTQARVLTNEALAATRVQVEDEDAIAERHATLRSLGVNAGGDMATTGSVGTPLKIAIGVMGAAAIGLGAWAMLGAHDAQAPHDEEVNAALPTPGAPTTLALTAASYGTDSWSWLNPRPRAMPTWFAVDVAADGSMAMVGEHGAAAHTIEGSMYTWRTGTEASLEAVRFTGAAQALAVGANGTMVRMTETGPHTLDSGTTSDLHAIAVVSPTETVIVGDGGLLLRLSGETITPLNLGITDDLLGAHARRGEAWLAGANGAIVHMTDLAAGRFQREHGPSDDTLRAIGGCERGSLYAVGDDGTIARRHADGGWHGLRLDIDTHETFTSVGCDRGRAVIVGASGLVVLASGDQTVRLASGYEGTWHGTAGAGETTWLVGGGGQIATIDTDHVVTRMDGPSVPLRDLATLGGAVVAVGEWGHIVREGANGFALGESATDAGLGALATVDESRLVAVGDLGAMVIIGPEHATLATSGVRVSLHDVIANDGQLLVVGNEGTLLRGAPESLAASRIADAGDLWSVAGTPTDAIVVGDNGFVSHVDASSHQVIACAGVSASLRAVVRDGAISYAVGEHGTIVRIEGSACTTEAITPASTTLPTLNAIAIGPHGRPFAVGDEGASFERGTDGSWTATDLEAGRSSLRGVVRVEQYVYVVGTGGTILRHIVVDGS